MSEYIAPGATIGVLGSGQLGRMFAIAARKMGYRIHTFSPGDDTPTGHVADLEMNASYNDLHAVEQFAKNVDVVTFEFENVPAETTACAAQFAPVRPGGHVLNVAQNRLREKRFLNDNGFPTTPFAEITTEEELNEALTKVGTPSVLKTAGWGYDGKGQAKIMSADDLMPAWERLAKQPAILEAFVDFKCEVSVVAARGVDGSFAHYGVMENIHANHILDVTVSHAPVSDKVYKQAVEVTQGIMDQLDVIGVLCVEFFLTSDDELLVNEMAPRPHNSGHITFDGCLTSQFEQQLRAICGLKLGATDYLRPVAMANLLGDVWGNGVPDWRACSEFSNVKIHLYGKGEPKPGRKMGHLTCLADTREQAMQQVIAARNAL